MNNYRFLFVLLVILTLLYCCRKEESNPVQPNIHHTYSPVVELIKIDSNYVKNLSVEVFFADSIIFICELKLVDYSSVNLLVYGESKNTDCNHYIVYEVIDSYKARTPNVRLKSCYGPQIPDKINLFDTYYFIEYQLGSGAHYQIAKIKVYMKVD